ncbi:hypothetical protein JHK85_006291 [Glycine max]|nr:hypothetical protein JHK85_006291 [Glycine max]
MNQEFLRGKDARQQTDRQNSRHGTLGNNLRLLTQSQNLVASEGRSGPTVAGKRKIEEVTRGQSEADGAEAGVNQSFTQQRMFGEKYTKGVIVTTTSKEKQDKNREKQKQVDATDEVHNNNESGQEMDLLMSHDFEIELQESHACPHDKEGDKPLMGLTKNTNTGINEGAEGNMAGKTNEPTKIVAVLWCLWHRRNEKLWNGVEKPINICLQFAIQHVHDWKIAHWRNLTSSNQSFRNYSLWTKPPIDHMKCNLPVSAWFHGLPSSHEAEAITLLSEINWTSDMQFDNIIFEIDCKPVADSINSRRFQNTEVGDILRSCPAKLSNFQSC